MFSFKKSLMVLFLVIGCVLMTSVSEARTYGFGTNASARHASDFVIDVHIQKDGWKSFCDNEIAGTTGQSKRIEAIAIDGCNGIDVKYRAHVNGLGWSSWVGNGRCVGTEGENKSITGIEIKCNTPGVLVLYRVHVSNVGWMDWVENGDTAGLPAGMNNIEAIQLKVIR